jgi:hypothetical protein
MATQLIDFADPAVRLNPYPEYKRMRESCPIAFAEGQKTW